MTDAETEQWLAKYCKISGRDHVIRDGIIETIDMVAFQPGALELKRIPVYFKNVNGWFDCSNLAHDVVFTQYPEHVGGRWLFASESQLGKELFQHLIASRTPFPLVLPLTGGYDYAGLLSNLDASSARYAQTDFQRQALWLVWAHCKNWFNVQMEKVAQPFRSPFTVQTERNNYRFIGSVNVKFNYRYKRYVIKRHTTFSGVDAFNEVNDALKRYWDSRDYLQLVADLQHTRYAEYLDLNKKVAEAAMPELDAL